MDGPRRKLQKNCFDIWLISSLKGKLQNDADINANTNEEHLRYKL